jgi:hypothetical protein
MLPSPRNPEGASGLFTRKKFANSSILRLDYHFAGVYLGIAALSDFPQLSLSRRDQGGLNVESATDSTRNRLRVQYVRNGFLYYFEIKYGDSHFVSERFVGRTEWLLGNIGSEVAWEVQKRIILCAAAKRHAGIREGTRIQSDSSRFHGFPGTTKATRIRARWVGGFHFLYFPGGERMLVAAHIA